MPQRLPSPKPNPNNLSPAASVVTGQAGGAFFTPRRRHGGGFLTNEPETTVKYNDQHPDVRNLTQMFCCFVGFIVFLNLMGWILR